MIYINVTVKGGNTCACIFSFYCCTLEVKNSHSHYYTFCYVINYIPKSCLSDADLNIAQTAWGDSGVYVCTVVSGQDLSGNNEDYTELIVLGKVHMPLLLSWLFSTVYL